MRKILLNIFAIVGLFQCLSAMEISKVPPVFQDYNRLISSNWMMLSESLPLSEDFESGSSIFTFTNTGQTNYWMIGTSTSSSGAKSLYITNDGVSNNYANGSTVAHAYAGVAIPAGTTEMSLSFDFKCKGESIYDYMRVWMVPDSYTPTAGTQITQANSQGLLLSVAEFNMSSDGKLNGTSNSLGTSYETNYGNLLFLFDGSSFAGQNAKLVFEWRNDGSVNHNPPASVDNVVLDVISCPGISGDISTNVNVDSITATWSSAGSATQWEVAIVPSGDAEPTSGTIVNNPSHTFTGLSEATEYDVYVRAVCSATETSLWKTTSVITSQNAVSLPFSQNFDVGDSGFIFGNANQTNHWMVGSDASASANQSMYITSDNSTNVYNGSNTSVSHAYKTVSVPAGTNDMALSFKFRCKGESSYDYMRVWMVPNSFIPTPGTQITQANSQGVLVSVAGFNSSTAGNLNGTSSSLGTSYQNNFGLLTFIFNGSTFAGQDAKLVFEWRNDGSVGNNPPAAVDDISLSVVSCPMISGSIQVTNTSVNTISVSWTAGGSETQWEVIALPAGSPSPTTTSTGTIVSTPNYEFTGLDEATSYDIYVRAICSSTLTSSWKVVTANTTQTAITLPFEENFDGASTNFVFLNSGQTNHWMIGNDAFASPNKSMYITNNDAANVYSSSATSVSQSYVTLSIPAGANDLALSFNFRCKGESSFDYMRVWMVPNTFTPTSGTQITQTNSQGTLISVADFNASTVGNLNGTSSSLGSSFATSFDNLVFIFDGSAYAGQDVKLVFEWRNDGSVADNPPAAVDDVQLVELTCPAVTDVVSTASTTDSVTIEWNTVGTETQWEVIILPEGSPAPSASTTGTITSTNTYTFTGLDEATDYVAYVRAVCGTNDSSFWTAGLVSTTQQLASIPYEENFDGKNPVFSTVNGSSDEFWFLGSATSSSPSFSMYISNNGTNYDYDGGNSKVYFYRDIKVPADAVEVEVSFDWKSEGDDNDYLKVWLAPTSFQPTAGQLIPSGSVAIPLTGKLKGETTWQTISISQNVQSFINDGSMRLIFGFDSNSFFSNTNPAAVDNVSVNYVTCPQPTNVIITKNVNGDIVVTWTPAGDETEWEIVIQEQDTGVPTPTTTVQTVQENPQYIFQAQEGVLYEVYIRAICGQNDKSLWTGPYNFSDFSPEACAEIDVEPLGFNVNSNGEYVVCKQDGGVLVNLEANFDTEAFKSTTSYNVQQIEYNPPFPFTEGTPMNISTDDIWSPVVDLPFEVCFYGNNFSTAQVSSNGAVVFGTNYTDGSDWSLTSYNSLPDTSFHNQYRNAILGVFQDINPAITNGGSTPSINYAVLGTYPCRALVVNYHDVDLFGESCYPNLPGQTYQIVIYEITNIVEVYVQNRNSCSAWNHGKGVIALINNDGTQATVPPGRNIGTWEAQNEAWRFTPSGDTTVEFGWYADGVLIGNTPVMDYTITQDTHFEARVTYPGCGGDDLILTKEFTLIVPPPVEVPEVIGDDIVICKYTNQPLEEVDLTIYKNKLEAEIINAGGNINDYQITYHLNETDAENAVNAIPNPTAYVPTSLPQTIYVTITHVVSNCHSITSFKIIEGKVPVMNTPEDVDVCDEYTLPELPNPLYSYGDITSYDIYNGQSNEIIEDKQAGDVLQPGKYQITINLVSEDGCVGEVSYEVRVLACDEIPAGISPNGDGKNDALDLAKFFPTSVKIYNRYGKEVFSMGEGYTNQWVGQDNSGQGLPSGTYFLDVETPKGRYTQWIQLLR